MGFGVPKHLSKEQQIVYRTIVRDMNDLEITHNADKSQIEMAAVLTCRLRKNLAQIESLERSLAMEEDLSIIMNMEERIDKKQGTYNRTATLLNQTLDRLGLSNTKRNPVKRDRGRPEKNPGTQPRDRDRRKWDRVLKAVK